MKIQILSDTHNSQYILAEEADVITHAGDFSNSGVAGVLEFVSKCQEANKEYILVLGNHDFYHCNIQEVYKKLKKEKVNVLTGDNSIQIQNKTFVGGTLFTNFRSNRIGDCDVRDRYMKTAEECVYDFSIIFKEKSNTLVTARDYITYFNKQYNYINQYRNKKDVIVLTHFPPHLACLDPYWGNHPTSQDLNPYFINDLDVKGFDLWISGHTHTAVDTVVDDCRLIVNPLGYPREQIKGNGFKPNLVIEI